MTFKQYTSSVIGTKSRVSSNPLSQFNTSVLSMLKRLIDDRWLIQISCRRKWRVFRGKETICICSEHCATEMSLAGVLSRSSRFFFQNGFPFKYTECQGSVIFAKYSQQPETKRDGR